MFGLKKIFGFSSKEEPATLAYVRRGTMEPEAFAVLRRHLLALEAEKASAWEAAPDEDPRAAYRRFLSLTDCRHSFVVALEQNGRKLPVGEWAKNHEGAARLLDLVDNELAVLVGDNRLAELSSLDLNGLQDIIDGFKASDFDTILAGFEPTDLDALLGEQKPDFGDEKEKELSQSEVTIQAGNYRFRMSQEDFGIWIDKLKQEVGFDKEAVIAEIRRRLAI